MDDSNVDIQVQLEGLRKDVENVNNIQTKIDTAIEKMTDVSSSIKSMLAVHEEKIAKQEGRTIPAQVKRWIKPNLNKKD